MAANSEIAIEGSLHASGGAGVVRMKTRFDTDIDDLWSALTDRERLARWYGNFDGDFQVGGTFAAFIPSSGWDGHGRVEECDAPRHLYVTMWESVGDEQGLMVDLVDDAGHTNLTLEKRGIAPDICWAYGAGWQAHLEDLAEYIAGRERTDLSVRWNMRFDELEPLYRKMKTTDLDL